MAKWLDSAMKTPETRLALGAAIPLGLLVVLAFSMSASPAIALRVLNFGVRDVPVGSGDLAPTTGEIAEGLLTGLPISNLKKPGALSVLLEAVDDNRLKVRTRVKCAELALRPSLTEEQIGRLKKALLLMGRSHFSSHGHAIFTVLLGGTFSGDKEVRAFLIDAARRDPMYTSYLARMKFREMIPIIERDLRTGRWHGYSALGAIGGPEAFDALARLLQTTVEPNWKFAILAAMGGTKDRRAKRVLLKHLESRDHQIYRGALRGLGYLGDPGTIPVLEKEFKAKGRDAERASILRTLEAVKAGGEPYYY